MSKDYSGGGQVDKVGTPRLVEIRNTPPDGLDKTGILTFNVEMGIFEMPWHKRLGLSAGKTE